MGCTATDSACLMKTSGGRSGTNLSKLLPRGCFPERANTKGKRGAFPLDKRDGGTGSKMPALKHDVDTREDGIMLSQAGKTVVPSKSSEVCQ